MKVAWLVIFLPAICIVFLRWFYREETEGRPEFELLSPLDEMERCLSLFTAAGHDVRAVQVLHPREVDFSFEAAAIFEDMESGRNLILDPGMARESYQQKYNAHNAALDGIFSAQGIPGFRVTTTEPLERVLQRFLEERPARAVVRQRRSNTRSAA